MAKFSIYLDRRGKGNTKQDYKFNLTVRVCHKSDTLYLSVGKLTAKQYERVFIKKSMDQGSIQLRETCNSYLTKCERIFSERRVFDRAQFRSLFYKTESGTDKDLSELKVKDLFDEYVSISGSAIKTKLRFKYTSRAVEKFKPGLSVFEITIDFLKDFEKHFLSQGKSMATIESHARDLRRVINYFLHVKKIIPHTYDYPFGKGGYSIGSTFTNKIILREEEIKSVITLNEFNTDEERYARDIWLFLYRCNGINFCDLLGLRWSDLKGEFFIFLRRKTKKTRKSNIKPVVVPLTEKFKEVLDRIAVKDSLFVLGQLHEGYSEKYFHNKSEKLKKAYNKHLTTISKKLNLSTALNLNTARRTYASTLYRSGVSKDIIGEMLVHSNSKVTEHYLGSMDQEKTFSVNQHVL